MNFNSRHMTTTITQDNTPAVFVRYWLWFLVVNFMQERGENTPRLRKFVGTNEVDLTSTEHVKYQTFISIRHLQTLSANQTRNTRSTTSQLGPRINSQVITRNTGNSETKTHLQNDNVTVLSE